VKKSKGERDITRDRGCLSSKEERVDKNSLVESPKRSLTIRGRCHATRRRKKRVESPQF
jgi:hypothetical protein